ncbi:thiosulfate sulfurtransferase [Sinobacterium caligoides]|uniref:Thiosulfate sulfurtransferase GlpE n=1 Tax=Sinobacterium caligoides TaxID=933926 RepID=A0A3N2DPB1_9GAMM|nr:thiosulfate sulfurtransferase GlpE [Sinobacterium caligoides]ROS01165.1 thiosulfate sulfurtransferase [Sinobacterium caligoides]
MTFQCISIDEAIELIATERIIIVDVRDQSSFQQGRIAGAQLLNNNTLGDFIASADTTHPVIVYCYHGHSSQGAAQFLSEQGFDTVYSLDGGFEEWRQQQPVDNDQ